MSTKEDSIHKLAGLYADWVITGFSDVMYLSDIKPTQDTLVEALDFALIEFSKDATVLTQNLLPFIESVPGDASRDIFRAIITARGCEYAMRYIAHKKEKPGQGESVH